MSEATSAAGTLETPPLLPVGAEVVPEGVRFRLWAPRASRVAVRLSPERSVPLDEEGDGYHSVTVPGIGAGALYRYELDGGKQVTIDPASRFQPDGPEGPSRVVDPGQFRWTDQAWRGVTSGGQVLYELHVGAFTRDGTWDAAARELPALADLGITMLELMPVADYPGRFGWGYDGVCLYAPSRLYGEPDDFRRFVDRAHSLGLGVVLDVVYNHSGPQGSCFHLLSDQWFSRKHTTDWGSGFNFDGDGSEPVREFFIANAAYWIREFHLDGLRLDATQDVRDDSAEHILSAVVGAARAAAMDREIFVLAENEPQRVWITRSREDGGWGIDALWNDDLHHTATVRLTGRREAYYTDYLGSPQEFVSTAKYGTLYQGQHYSWQKQRRGTPALDRRPTTFVNYLQNHDQVANALAGLRIHQIASPGELRAMTALLLLLPQTPLLFMGQEFAAERPFLYFADLAEELRPSVRNGRGEFLTQFPSLSRPEAQEALPDPFDPATFERCRLDHSEREKKGHIWNLHRDLLQLRRTDPVLSGRRRRAIDGAVVSNDAFLLRAFGEAETDRILLVNLGTDLPLRSAPEPLLAPPDDARWEVLWQSEAVKYGGSQAVHPEGEDGWRLTGRSATVLKAVRLDQGEPR